jgi:iron(III) transport system substrate-binding protein
MQPILRNVTLILVAGMLAFWPQSRLRAENYSGSYAAVVDGAKREGQLVVYSNTHMDVARDLLADFRSLYPFVNVKYWDLNAFPIYRRLTTEIAAHQSGADFVWSSAMDLQEKLINDGYAQHYTTPEKANLPSWARWNDLGYGVTSEPIVLVYNRRFIGPHELPRSHPELERLLRTQTSRFRGKVAVYDPVGTEVGMLFLSQDVRITQDTWNLVKAFGQTDAQFYGSSHDILQEVSQGNKWIGYNVIGSYALEWQKQNPDIGIIYPSDYILTMSRVAFISATAQHPNSAKLFLDFLLSRRGQRDLAKHSMDTVRQDVPPSNIPRLDPVRIQAIRVGPSLLVNLDRLVRARFLRHWKETLGGGTAAMVNSALRD